MKKTKRKAMFVLVMALISAISLTAFPASAGSGLTLGDIDFAYEGMSTEQAENIVRVMFGIQDNSAFAQPHFICISHSLNTGVVITTQHNAYAANPRCRQTNEHVEFCTRFFCNHFVITDTNTRRVGCC
jgi:hypothetical protein